MGIRLLTVRDRTCAEITRLLAARSFARTDIQATLDRLKAEGYLDDRRFALIWTRSRLRAKPMGPYRLSRELEVRGIEAPLVREVLEDAYGEGEEVMARRAIAAKRSTLERVPAASRMAPMARFLQRRGFSADVIWRLLHEEQEG